MVVDNIHVNVNVAASNSEFAVLATALPGSNGVEEPLIAGSLERRSPRTRKRIVMNVCECGKEVVNEESPSERTVARAQFKFNAKCNTVTPFLWCWPGVQPVYGGNWRRYHTENLALSNQSVVVIRLYVLSLLSICFWETSQNDMRITKFGRYRLQDGPGWLRKKYECIYLFDLNVTQKSLSFSWNSIWATSAPQRVVTPNEKENFKTSTNVMKKLYEKS